MSGPATTIASWANSIKVTLDQLNKDSDTIFNEAGINPSILTNPSNRILVTKMTELWELCVLNTGREDFGLLVANNAFPTMFHTLGVALFSSRSLSDSIKTLQRHSSTVSNIGNIASVNKGGHLELHIVLDENQEAPSHIAIDAFMLVIASFPVRFMGGLPKIKEVHMRRPPPKRPRTFYKCIRGSHIF